MAKHFLNANNVVLGRLASYVAQKAINGDDVVIVNAENAVVSGNRLYLLDRFKQRLHRGTPTSGPFFPRTSKGIVRRAIRGMLPYKQERGLKAFKRVRVYEGMPEGFKDIQFEIPTKTKFDFTHKKYVTIKSMISAMGRQK